MWTFKKSASNLESIIKHENSEVVFWGRSNVGKSSLINAIAKSGIAKTSSTPGRTRLINYFINNKENYLVDLPGYGYAKVNKKMQQEIDIMIDEYFKFNSNIKCVFLLIDSRIGFLNSDIEVIDYLNSLNLPQFIIFTKTDKLNQSGKSKLNKLIKDNNIQNFIMVSTNKKINIVKLNNIVENYLFNY